MARNSDTTHARNLENLQVAINIVEEIGDSFRPANPIITLTALREFRDRLATLLGSISQAMPAEQVAVGRQMTAFSDVERRVNRITKVARSLSLSPEFLRNLRSTSRRMTGGAIERGAETAPNGESESADAATPRPARTYGRKSYAAMIETLQLLEEQLRGNPGYAPNEPEYRIDSISEWIADLRRLHEDALRQKAATLAARNARNAFAYNDADGLHARAKVLKAYCETVLDRNDTRLRALRRLKFRKLG